MLDFIYTEILFRPLYNAMIFIVDLLPGHEVWIAIVLLTLLIKFILYPLSMSSIKSQRAMQELQPKLNEIREKYKDDKQKQSQEMMKFYRKNKINPLSSCLPLLIQLPILIGLYRVFRDGLNPDSLVYLYSFVSAPEFINNMFLGIDLAQTSIVGSGCQLTDWNSDDLYLPGDHGLHRDQLPGGVGALLDCLESLWGLAAAVCPEEVSGQDSR
jgi:YidC/Oxa1 family membrane protein insertase